MSRRSTKESSKSSPIGSAAAQRVQLEALYEMTVDVLEVSDDARQVMQKALTHCRQLTGSPIGFIGLDTEDRTSMDVVAYQGFEPDTDFYRGSHLLMALRPPILAKAAQRGQPSRSKDAKTDPKHVGQPRGHPEVHAFLGVPLRAVGRTIGMIGVANRTQRYTADDERLLTAFAAHVGIAIRLASPAQDLRLSRSDLQTEIERQTSELGRTKQVLEERARQLEELLQETLTIEERARSRIAHDIHDGVNQLIVGSMYQTTAARKRLRSHDLQEVEKALEEIRSNLSDAARELRGIVFDLRPSSLDSVGLAEAAKDHVGRFQQRSHVESTFEAHGKPRKLPEHIEIAAYRVLQEALNNAERHSGAKTVQVGLRYGPRALELTIADDGRGFNRENATAGGHMGLIGMQERARSVGGQLQVDSRPGSGTRITFHVPLA